MKKFRIFIFLSLSIFALLTGCSKDNKKADVIYTLNCTANINFNGEIIDCNLCREAPLRASFQIKSPDYRGLTYYWSGKDFSISYNGLSIKNTECLLPNTSFAVQIMKVIDFAEQNKDKLDVQGNQISGNNNGNNFSIVVDNKTGLIKSIAIPQNNISVKLYDHE